MRPNPVRLLALITAAGMLFAGCARDSRLTFSGDMGHYREVLAGASYGDAQVAPQLVLPGTPPPLAMRPDVEPEYWELSLSEAIRLGLSGATVLRDLGGTVLQAPESLETLQNPSIVETDPRFGVDAALSAFDAELVLNGYFENNDRVLNNFFTAGAFQFQQDRHDYEAALRKRGATGTQYVLRQTWDYDANNATNNLFPSAWDTAVEGEIRQPLLQGGGIEYNRIAGPYATPGNLNGVVIARINTDISMLDLEIGLRDFVSNVENAYWDLYFAYRDLDAKRRARDESLRLWQNLAAKRGLPGAEEDRIEQAREQYFRFEADVENALSGRLLEGTRAEADTTGGTFRATGGVYVTERRLRLLLGLPLNDVRLLRPSQDPSLARVIFDWDSVVGECLTRRSELRRQRLAVQRRELELIAHRNFLKPRLDAVGTYRWRGFGDDLLDPSGNGPRFDDAYSNLTSGDFQEWRLGFEFNMPLGFRQGYAAIRNSQLLLARDKAILQEQERQILHDLSNALSEAERAYKVAMVNLNRRNAAQERLRVLQDKADLGNIMMVDLTLDAQQRLAAAESDFFRSVAEYALAIKNVHVEKGTWKTYHEVFLAEELFGCGECLAQPLPATAVEITDPAPAAPELQSPPAPLLPPPAPLAPPPPAPEPTASAPAVPIPPAAAPQRPIETIRLRFPPGPLQSEPPSPWQAQSAPQPARSATAVIPASYLAPLE